jgi:hypothetical protein
MVRTDIGVVHDDIVVKSAADSEGLRMNRGTMGDPTGFVENFKIPQRGAVYRFHEIASRNSREKPKAFSRLTPPM